MLRFAHFLVLVLLFLFSFVANAGNYLDGVLLRAEGDIKVYLISGGTKKWVSSIEVFNLNNFKWQSVKTVSKKEISTIEEGEPIVLETVLSTPSPEPISRIIPTPPIPAKINTQFPSPDYIRADWLVSHTTSNYGRIGQRIIFKYSDKEMDKVENFRLYEKGPGHTHFAQIASFEEVPSTNCKDIDIDGEWMMTEAGQCGYWSIQRITPPGGRDMVAYLPTKNYSEGEYSYYVAGVDKNGLETQPSPETKLVFLSPVDIFSPTDNQQTTGIYPVFKWSISNSWPASSVPDYFVSISDDEAAQNPLWAKQIKVSPVRLSEGQESKFDESLTYDGLGLDPTKKYEVYIYGHYRKSEHDPDYISIPSTVPEFWVKSTSSARFFRGLLKALFLGPFDFLR